MPTTLPYQDDGQWPPPSILQNEFYHLYKQKLVDAESMNKTKFRNSLPQELGGTKVLLLVDTEDADEVEVLKEKVRKDLKGADFSIYKATTHVRMTQTYNEQGAVLLAERGEAMVDFVKQNPKCIPKDIKTVVIGVIQGYIRTSRWDGSSAAFEVVTLYNTMTEKVSQGVSRGVPLQAEYLRYAREENISYGEALGNYFCRPAETQVGCDFEIAKDWRQAICGQSRYALLYAIVQQLDSIFPDA